MEKLKNVLDEYLKKQGLEHKILEIKAVDMFNSALKARYPELEFSEAVDMKDGILKVNAADSVLAFELDTRKELLVSEINLLLSEPAVKDIIIRIGGGFDERK